MQFIFMTFFCIITRFMCKTDFWSNSILFLHLKPFKIYVKHSRGMSRRGGGGNKNTELGYCIILSWYIFYSLLQCATFFEVGGCKKTSELRLLEEYKLKTFLIFKIDVLDSSILWARKFASKAFIQIQIIWIL